MKHHDSDAYRARESAANDRADELLAGTGMTLGTMDAETYERLRRQLRTEQLWHG